MGGWEVVGSVVLFFHSSMRLLSGALMEEIERIY